MACLHRVAEGTFLSRRSWSVHLVHGRPGGRFHKGSGGRPTDSSTWRSMAWCAGVLSCILATCPNVNGTWQPWNQANVLSGCLSIQQLAFVLYHWISVSRNIDVRNAQDCDCNGVQCRHGLYVDLGFLTWETVPQGMVKCYCCMYFSMKLWDFHGHWCAVTSPRKMCIFMVYTVQCVETANWPNENLKNAQNFTLQTDDGSCRVLSKDKLLKKRCRMGKRTTTVTNVSRHCVYTHLCL